MYMKTRNVWILAALLCGQIGVQAQEALPKEVKVGKERIKARFSYPHYFFRWYCVAFASCAGGMGRRIGRHCNNRSY